jgi:Trypsin-co-occurring domain 1
METATENVKVKLADGTEVLVAATTQGGEQAISAKIPDFGEITGQIEGIATTVYQSLKAVAPTKTTVEFGIEIALESGGLMALLAKGSTTANLKITLEWSDEKKKK